jgi:hypothetical protein
MGVDYSFSQSGLTIRQVGGRLRAMTAQSPNGEHAFPINAPRDSFFLEDFADRNNTTSDTPFNSSTADPDLLRRIDHGRTVDIMRQLGHSAPTAADRADAVRLRHDTLRRQADPATRHYLDQTLRRLHATFGGERLDGGSDQQADDRQVDDRPAE